MISADAPFPDGASEADWLPVIHIQVFTVGEPFGLRLEPRFEGIT
jgi:hypothetical protein